MSDARLPAIIFDCDGVLVDSEYLASRVEAEAKSMQIRAEALEQNAKLVEWEAVQKWNGVLPQYMLGNGTMPFLNLTPPKE